MVPISGPFGSFFVRHTAVLLVSKSQSLGKPTAPHLDDFMLCLEKRVGELCHFCCIFSGVASCFAVNAFRTWSSILWDTLGCYIIVYHYIMFESKRGTAQKPSANWTFSNCFLSSTLLQLRRLLGPLGDSQTNHQ